MTDQKFPPWQKTVERGVSLLGTSVRKASCSWKPYVRASRRLGVDSLNSHSLRSGDERLAWARLAFNRISQQIGKGNPVVIPVQCKWCLVNAAHSH